MFRRHAELLHHGNVRALSRFRLSEQFRLATDGVEVGEVADIMFDESLQTHCH
jgi:hypothetical protein